VLIGSDNTYELWHSTGSLCLLRLMVGASVMLKMICRVDRSSSIVLIRCVMRSFRWLVPGTELEQYSVNGRLDRLCLASRKSSLMVTFEDR
jgi:hypothetical protein